MFSNYIDLIYVNGISKLNKIKIINMDKMFYNCISLIFFPYENEININININKYDDSFLGINITRYLKYNKEIIIK